MYINRGLLLNLFLLLKRIFHFLNKHFYLVLIISTITKYTNNSFYKYFTWIIKVFIFLNIIFGVGYIVYFSVLESSFLEGVSSYKELFLNYIDYIVKFWNDLISIDIEESFIKKSSNKDINALKDVLREEVKEGIKDGFKELIDEAMDKMNETDPNKVYKNIAFAGGILFFIYFITVVPINPENLSDYNTFNQILIDFKSNVVNHFTGGSKGNNGGNSGTNTALSLTETPNTPITSNTAMSSSSTQTVLDGLTVGRLLESMDIVNNSLNKDEFNKVTDLSVKSITNITD